MQSTLDMQSNCLFKVWCGGSQKNLAWTLLITCLYFQTYGQKSEIVSSKCNKHGIRVLELSDPVGPLYHYEEPTNTTLGDQPNLRDPLENKYMYIKKSEFNGEGAFAARDLPENLIYANYGGFLYTGKDFYSELWRNIWVEFWYLCLSKQYWYSHWFWCN